MSTKTTFKRIALVAVAALGLGTVSVAPSSAAVLVGANTNTLAMVSNSTTIVAGESATATFTSTFVGQVAYDSVAVEAFATSTQAPALRLSVSDSSTSVAGGVRVGDAGSTTATDATANVGVTGAAAITVTYKLHVYAPTTVGTYNISIYATPATAGVAQTTYATPLTWTFTVTARDTVPTANSTVTLRSGENTTSATPFGGTTEGTDSSTALTATRSITSDDAAATIFVVQKNATSTAGESITVVATGPAFITTSATRPVAGSALTLAADAAGTRFYVFSTGTAGTATITVSTPSLAMGSKTIKFFGAAASLAVSKAVAPKTVIRTTAGTSTSDVAVITVLDANANAVTNLAASAFTATPSDRLQIASASVGAYSSTLGGYPLSTVSAAGTSGKTATITVSIADPADTTGVKTLTTSHAVTMGGVVAKEVISFDKASYSPGEQMIITITATDAAGNPVFTGAAAPALSSNKTIQGLANLATTYTAGKADTVSRDVDAAVLDSFRAYAPATAGDFRVTATGTDALATIISASATVADPAVDAATDAANEATDAANAATDAALAAADAADAATAAAQDASDAVAALSASVSKLISSLRAQITSLTNLVIKIQKKVRA
jgi:trimeric autotransporter adhesin